MARAVIGVAPAGPGDVAAWSLLRHALWPDEAAGSHAAEIEGGLESGSLHGWLARSGRETVAFVEATLRRDYVNGRDGSPVAFVEGLYVAPDQRRRGVARALIGAVVNWAVREGVAELASDALLDNAASHRMHAALGFAETERVVFFRRALAT